MPTDIRGSQVEAVPGDDAGGTVGRDVSRDQGGDQAAWRDLVARLELPSSVDPANAPWPDRENLRNTADPGNGAQSSEQADRENGRPPRADPDRGRPAHGGAEQRPGGAGQGPGQAEQGPGGAGQGPGDGRPRDRGHVIRPAGTQRNFPAVERQPPEATQQPHGGRHTRPQGSGRPADEDYPDTPTSPDLNLLDFLDADDDDPDDPENRFIPPPVPPMPRLDPVAKGAWTALFGGPGYLLLATMLGWQVPGWAELLAVAAFIIAFVVLVSRLGDGPSRKDGPDQGAVV